MLPGGATSVYRCEGTKITRLARHPDGPVAGHVLFADHPVPWLCLQRGRDHKVMGLASFGDPQRHAGFFQNAIQARPQRQRGDFLPDAEPRLCRKPVLHPQRRSDRHRTRHRRQDLRAPGTRRHQRRPAAPLHRGAVPHLR